jgi:hypothetical protein
MANVLDFPNDASDYAFKKEIREGHEQETQGRDLWRVGVMRQAIALAEKREQFKSDNAFGAYLAENDLDFYTHQDRAAYIKLGQNPDAARIALEETTRSSVRLIVSEELPEIINRFTNTGKPTNSEHKISEQPENNAEADDSENINSDIAENSPPVESKTTSRSSSGGRSQSKVRGRGRPPKNEKLRTDFQNIINIFATQSGARQHWEKMASSLRKADKSAHAMIVEAHSLGLIGRSDDFYVVVSSDETATSSSRLLCNLKGIKTTMFATHILDNYDLAKSGIPKRGKGVGHAEAELMPFFRAHSQDLINDPANAWAIWNKYEASIREERIAKQKEEKRQEGLAMLSRNIEKPVVMYGTTVWPAKSDSYSYEDLRIACVMFRANENMAHTGTKEWQDDKYLGETSGDYLLRNAKSRAKLHRFQVKYMRQAAKIMEWKYGESVSGPWLSVINAYSAIEVSLENATTILCEFPHEWVNQIQGEDEL